MAQAALPTYKTAAQALEGHNGAGIRLAGYTVLRTLMIAPPFMLLGIPTKTAFVGAMLSSVLMSTFVMLRIFDARNTGLDGIKRHRYRRLK